MPSKAYRAVCFVALVAIVGSLGSLTYQSFAIEPLPKPVLIVDASGEYRAKMAEEIARQEGWGVPGSLVRRLHNPGALVYVGQEGAEPHTNFNDGICLGTSPCWIEEKSPYAYFKTDDAGWTALRREIWRKWDSLHNIKLACRNNSTGLYHPCEGTNEVYARYILSRWPERDGERYADLVMRRMR